MHGPNIIKENISMNIAEWKIFIDKEVGKGVFLRLNSLTIGNKEGKNHLS